MAISYIDQQNAMLVAWKLATTALCDEARIAGTYRGKGAYDVCLPREHAALNLLPEVREEAIALFRELNIAWHDGVDGGPSNHLRDSQVQCVNALFAMRFDAERIKRAFGTYVDIAEVLPVDPEIEPDALLTFEFIGPTDYFGEGVRHGKEVGRQRGTNCTSVDAAFRYRTSHGEIELALVEWKYTETYRRAVRVTSSDEVRRERYAATLYSPDSPIEASLLEPFERFLDEPLYQLMRQQLLAHRLESDPAEPASTVRVLNVLADANEAYSRSLHHPETKALGKAVAEVWQNLLRTPDRFKKVDPAVFLNPLVTSPEYVARYGG